MKLITAIVNKKDAVFVSDALRDHGIYHTKMSTSGGFLGKGNVTLLIGVEDEQLETALTEIKNHCRQRMEQIPTFPVTPNGIARLNYMSTEVLVGGATVFVTDVVRFEKY